MKNKKETIKLITKYTLIFSFLIFILLSIFIRNNKSFIWINVSNDGLDQHLINLHFFKNLFANFLKTGEINTFIWNIGYGIDMFANLAYYIFGDFLSYLALFTKKEHLDTLYGLIIILRLYLVGISFIIYTSKKNINKNNILIGALTYTFSGFSIFALARHPYFINPLIIFPILMLTTEKQIKENKPIPFIIMVFITFISSFYFGYMMSICIMIYGIIITLSHNKKKPLSYIIKNLLKTFFYALIGVLLSSFILIPTAYAFLTSTRTDSSIYLYTITYYKNLIETLISTNNTGNWTIIGLSSIILAILPQFIHNRKKEKDIFTYLIILLIPILIPFIASIFAGFSYPNNRWTFIINFILSYIISITLDKYKDLNIKKTLIFIIIYSLLIFIINKQLNTQLTVSIICSILFTITIYYQKKLNKLYPIILLSILTLNLGYNTYYTYQTNGYINEFVESDALSLYKDANNQIPYLSDATNYLKEIDNTYYNTIIYPNNLYNLSMINNYNSISYFYSIVNNNYLSIATDLENQELGINKEIKNFNNRTKITTLLNTKYLITTNPNYIPYGYKQIKNYHNQTYIYQNMYNLSFANLYTNYIDESYYNTLSPLDKENILLESTIIDKSTNIKPNYTYESNIKKIPYTTNNINIFNNTIEIKDKINTKLNINIPYINNCEIYLYIKNIKFTPSINNNTAYNITASINNKTFTEGLKNKNTNAYYFKNDDILINLGYYQELNDTLELTFQSIGTYTFDSIDILSINFDNYQESINNLNQSNFILKDYDNNYLTGTINPTQDGIIEFTTNYSKGWKVYVDDKEVKTFKSNKYFLGINITKGEHKIHLEYTTPYKNLGLIISIITSTIFIYIIIKERKYK